MKPQHFVLLAVTALLSLVAAVTTYTAATPWTQQLASNAPLFPGLKDQSSRVAEIAVSQAGRATTMARAGDQWVLKNRDGYPANPDKVRALVSQAAEALLVESKTRNPERYKELSLEDPADKTATSTLFELRDDKGTVLAEAIIGKKKSDAFGANKVGTYVRRPGDAQTWLANTPIDTGTSLRDWVNTKIFDTVPEKIKRVMVEVAGEEPLDISATGDKHNFTLAKMPDGMKLKFANSLDSIVDEASLIEFVDLKKAGSAAAAPAASKVTIETEAGLKTVLAIRKDGSDTWVSATATGEGDAKKTADDMTKRLAGWEFRVGSGKAEQILKKRADLLEKMDAETPATAPEAPVVPMPSNGPRLPVPGSPRLNP